MGQLGENFGVEPDKSQKQKKKEVIDEARNGGRKVHSASLMDLCHLKKSELEPSTKAELYFEVTL